MVETTLWGAITRHVWGGTKGAQIAIKETPQARGGDGNFCPPWLSGIVKQWAYTSAYTQRHSETFLNVSTLILVLGRSAACDDVGRVDCFENSPL